MREVIVANVALILLLFCCGGAGGMNRPTGTKGLRTEVRGGGEMTTFTPVLSGHRSSEATPIDLT